MELEIIRGIASSGSAAILAFLIFIMYRRDRRDSEKRLNAIIEAEQRTREDNTKAVTELVILLSRLNGKLAKS